MIKKTMHVHVQYLGVLHDGVTHVGYNSSYGIVHNLEGIKFRLGA